MTAGTLIFLGVIIVALAAMELLARGLPSRCQGWCSTYGTSKNFSGKDTMRLAILALNEGRFGLNPFEREDEEGRAAD